MRAGGLGGVWAMGGWRQWPVRGQGWGEMGEGDGDEGRGMGLGEGLGQVKGLWLG